MSCSVHDVVAIETRGVPTAVVGTEPFRDEAEEQATALGMPAYAMVEVPHPIQPLPIQRVAALADAFADQIVHRLTAHPA